MIKKEQTKLIKPGVILLGFIALVSQVVLLREFLTFFSGNELVIGIILANWMLLTGFGAYLGRGFKNDKNRINWILILIGILAFLPIISVLCLHYIWYSIFLPGVLAGILHVFYYSLTILSPFCIISGILFTILSKEESLVCNRNRIGDVYAWESVGSLLGGIIVNFVLLWFFTTFQSLFIVMIVGVILIAIIGIKIKRFLISIIFISLGFISSFLFLTKDFDNQIRKIAYPGQEIKFVNDSPFGLFVISQQNGQTNYYENNVLMSSSGDIISKEESVHFAMVQHSNPKDILVLSGIVSGVISEVQKYNVSCIDYVDVNPKINEIAKKFLDLDSISNFNLIEKDALRYLKSSTKKYDIVLINLPKPSTIQLNRYYTREFFETLKGNLKDSAIISMSVPSNGNYLNEEAKMFMSIIYNTLKSTFKFVEILPAGEDFLLASDSKLTLDIVKKINDIGINTEYVNEFYLSDDLLKIRSDQIKQQLNLDAPLNKDLSPVFYQSQIKLWMSKFNIKYWIPGLLILIFSGFFFFKSSSIYKGVFAAGFAGTSIEIVLMLVFQVFFGYVYAVAGIFIMIFMGGLAFGSYYIPKLYKKVDKKLFRKLQLSVAILSFILPIIFILFKNTHLNDYGLIAIFTILILIISILTGAIFSVASKIIKSDYAVTAARAYGLDLLGAATGALLFTIYLIPIMGFAWSLIFVGVVSFLIAGFTKG